MLFIVDFQSIQAAYLWTFSEDSSLPQRQRSLQQAKGYCVEALKLAGNTKKNVVQVKLREALLKGREAELEAKQHGEYDQITRNLKWKDSVSQ